eukprot:m.244029 g.244029  ORF g.244029 m.244029 type:complete len:705 (+) comp26616_c0_seq2:30-2144(+)
MLRLFRSFSFSSLGISPKFIQKHLRPVHPLLGVMCQPSKPTAHHLEFYLHRRFDFQTNKKEERLINLLAEQDEHKHCIGTADVFVSHTWLYSPTLLLESILQHATRDPTKLAQRNLGNNNNNNNAHISPPSPSLLQPCLPVSLSLPLSLSLFYSCSLFLFLSHLPTFGDISTHRYWLDLFSLSHHPNSEKKIRFDDLDNKVAQDFVNNVVDSFSKMVQGADKFLLVLDEDFRALTRYWCLWEIYSRSTARSTNIFLKNLEDQNNIISGYNDNNDIQALLPPLDNVPVRDLICYFGQVDLESEIKREIDSATKSGKHRELFFLKTMDKRIRSRKDYQVVNELVKDALFRAFYDDNDKQAGAPALLTAELVAHLGMWGRSVTILVNAALDARSKGHSHLAALYDYQFHWVHKWCYNMPEPNAVAKFQDARAAYSFYGNVYQRLLCEIEVSTDMIRSTVAVTERDESGSGTKDWSQLVESELRPSRDGFQVEFYPENIVPALVVLEQVEQHITSKFDMFKNPDKDFIEEIRKEYESTYLVEEKPLSSKHFEKLHWAIPSDEERNRLESWLQRKRGLLHLYSALYRFSLENNHHTTTKDYSTTQKELATAIENMERHWDMANELIPPSCRWVEEGRLACHPNLLTIASFLALAHGLAAFTRNSDDFSDCDKYVRRYSAMLRQLPQRLLDVEGLHHQARVKSVKEVLGS